MEASAFWRQAKHLGLPVRKEWIHNLSGSLCTGYAFEFQLRTFHLRNDYAKIQAQDEVLSLTVN